MLSLTVSGVSYRYSNAPEPVFDDLTFTVQAGDIVALVGPSGSGKSTLLSIIGRSARPTQGTVALTGVDSIQWVFQNPHGPAHRTAIDIASMPALARGSRRHEAEREAAEAMGTVNLTHRTLSPFHTLSGGEAQRLMLARAIVARPQLLIVDEPTAQLDSTSAAKVIETLREIGDNERVVIIATHDQRVVDACTQEVRLDSV